MMNYFILFLFLIAPSLLASTRTEIRGRVAPHIVRVQAGGGGGTGFVVSTPDDQYVVTNYHVCEAGNLKINGVAVNIIKINVRADLCLLTPPHSHQGGLRISNKPPGIGDSVSSVGYPANYPLTMSDGEVVGPMTIKLCEDFTNCSEFTGIMTTIQVVGGNSGSPVLNMRGEVVGVIAVREGWNGWGMMVPYNELRHFLKGL